MVDLNRKTAKEKTIEEIINDPSASGSFTLDNDGGMNLGTAGFANMYYTKLGNMVIASVEVFVDTQNTGGNLTGSLLFSLPSGFEFLTPDADQYGKIKNFSRYVNAGNNDSDFSVGGGLVFDSNGDVRFATDRTNDADYPVFTNVSIIAAVGGAVTGHRYFFQGQIIYPLGSL